jgi:phosphatidylglycerol lysyltransferase
MHVATIREVSLADPDEAERVLRLVKRFGRQATSFQVLEPGLAYWFCEPDACVAYCDTGQAWVSAGEPLCAPERVAEVVAGFVRAARAARRRVRFFQVSAAFVAASGLPATHVGEEPVWDPQHWPDILRSTRSLREQLRRARAKGVRVRTVEGSTMGDPTSPERRAAEHLVERWLGSRGMAAMKFMVLLHPFSYPEERRFAVAEQHGHVVAFAAAIPVYGKHGYFIEDLVRDPEAPSGTVELLVDALMRDFAARGARFATLGLSPLSGDVGAFLAVTRRVTARLYNFPGVRAFKEKLRPRAWEPVYLAVPPDERPVLAMIDVLHAFAPGGFVRFLGRVLLHQRARVTTLLAVLLVPWTVLLASAETLTWYPSRTAQLAWVLFDAGLCGLLFAQARRWTSGRARLLAWLTSADAAVTLGQTLWWNVWTTRGLVGWLLVLVGFVGPLAAAVFFVASRRVLPGTVRGDARSK